MEVTTVLQGFKVRSNACLWKLSEKYKAAWYWGRVIFFDEAKKMLIQYYIPISGSHREMSYIPIKGSDREMSYIPIKGSDREMSYIPIKGSHREMSYIPIKGWDRENEDWKPYVILFLA